MNVLKSKKAYTLLEVMVSILITAVMVTSVFSVSLTSKRANNISDRKLVAAQSARRMTSTLEDYVTADNTAASTIAGPQGGGAGASSWTLPGDSTGGYALAAGSHTLAAGNGYLPGWLEAAPYNGQVIYYVACLSGNCPPNCNGSAQTSCTPPWVNVTVTWTEP